MFQRGAKRPRTEDGFGGRGSMGDMGIGAAGDGNSSFPAVRLRGLPFSVTEADVTQFLVRGLGVCILWESCTHKLASKTRKMLQGCSRVRNILVGIHNKIFIQRFPYSALSNGIFYVVHTCWAEGGYLW